MIQVHRRGNRVRQARPPFPDLVIVEVEQRHPRAAAVLCSRDLSHRCRDLRPVDLQARRVPGIRRVRVRHPARFRRL
uniref:Uncharacterized protein n=1 Tax=Arundo donax TaxID=35708 RepID=A0A0A9H7C6_ARUDO